jgi:hypothetical protein
VEGGELAPLVTALDIYEPRHVDLAARRLTAETPTVSFDPAAIRCQLEGYLVNWRGLLRTNVPQGQQILKRLIKGRLTFTPQVGHYAFAGEGTTQPLSAGLV